MSKRRNQSKQHPNPDMPHDEAPQAERPAWVGDESKQQSMASRSQQTRTKMSVGQANTMRLKKGNQPRGGR